MKKRIFSILFFSILFCFVFSISSFAMTSDGLPETLEDLPAYPTKLSDGSPVTDYFIEKYIGANQSQFNIYLFSDYQETGGKFELISDSSTGNTYVKLNNGQNFKYEVYGNSDYGFKIGEGWVKSTSAQTSDKYIKFSNLVLHTFNKLNTNDANSYNYLKSTIDFKTNDGSVFFQVPPTELYQMIHKVTEEGLATELTLGGTIRILLLCGVGLMALLVVLNLFGKVFNRYRN